MITLDSLHNVSRQKKYRKRVGRGIGSGIGKTSGRGEKGAGSRAGYKRRFGKEGGQFPLFMKTPKRGFSNAPFREVYDVINLGQLDALYEAGEKVNLQSLKDRGFGSVRAKGLKILGEGELTKKLVIEAHAASKGAKEKLAKAKINVTWL